MRMSVHRTPTPMQRRAVSVNKYLNVPHSSTPTSSPTSCLLTPLSYHRSKHPLVRPRSRVASIAADQLIWVSLHLCQQQLRDQTAIHERVQTKYKNPSNAAYPDPQSLLIHHCCRTRVDRCIASWRSLGGNCA